MNNYTKIINNIAVKFLQFPLSFSAILWYDWLNETKKRESELVSFDRMLKYRRWFLLDLEDFS